VCTGRKDDQCSLSTPQGNILAPDIPMLLFKPEAICGFLQAAWQACRNNAVAGEHPLSLSFKVASRCDCRIESRVCFQPGSATCCSRQPTFSRTVRISWSTCRSRSSYVRSCIGDDAWRAQSSFDGDGTEQSSAGVGSRCDSRYTSNNEFARKRRGVLRTFELKIPGLYLSAPCLMLVLHEALQIAV